MKKITELEAINTIDKTDIIPIVDYSEGTTKKATVNGVVKSVLSDYIKDELVIATTRSKTIAETVIENWAKLPKGVPFMCKMVCLGEGFICGYIYESGSYGSIMVSQFGGTWIISCSNGSFTTKQL